MSPFLVRCLRCTRTWHSRTMAEGLRRIGSCPRCGGTLEWADGEIDTGPDASGAAPTASVAARDAVDGVAPHLVLGVPRREF